MRGQLSCEKCGSAEACRYDKDDRGWQSECARWMCRSCIAMTMLVSAIRRQMWRARNKARRQNDGTFFDPSTRSVKQILKGARDSARRYGLPSTLTNAEWQCAVEFFMDSCAYCGSRWNEVEHATPLHRGGGTSAGNCLPTCAYCNDEKRYHTLEELLAKDLWPHRTARLEQALTWLRQNGRGNSC